MFLEKREFEENLEKREFEEKGNSRVVLIQLRGG